MIGALPRKRGLSAEQCHALAMLADAGRNGVTAAIILANGFQTKMLAHLDRDGLATAMIAERVKDGGRTIEVIRFRITAAGRRALTSQPNASLPSAPRMAGALSAHFPAKPGPRSLSGRNTAAAVALDCCLGRSCELTPRGPGSYSKELRQRRNFSSLSHGTRAKEQPGQSATDKKQRGSLIWQPRYMRCL